jgi:hypothetical protein
MDSTRGFEKGRSSTVDNDGGLDVCVKEADPAAKRFPKTKFDKD